MESGFNLVFSKPFSKLKNSPTSTCMQQNGIKTTTGRKPRSNTLTKVQQDKMTSKTEQILSLTFHNKSKMKCNISC